MSHIHGKPKNQTRLYWAVGINVLLTVVQVVAGLVSGSLALVADAIHNLSDAGSLLIALIAMRVSERPANENLTYGYGRAEILGTLINSTSLLVVGIYLIYEAVGRFAAPEPIDGWTVILVGAFALIIDVATAMIVHDSSKESSNIRAAFIHNVSDALASVVVIVSGTLALNFKIYVFDLLATIAISVYVLYQSYGLLKHAIRIFMQAVPADLEVAEIEEKISQLAGIRSIHHVHVWQLDDKRKFLEAHVVVETWELARVQAVKEKVKQILKSEFGVAHSTLEFEVDGECR